MAVERTAANTISTTSMNKTELRQNLLSNGSYDASNNNAASESQAISDLNGQIDMKNDQNSSNGSEGRNTIFANHLNIFTQSDPQPNWLFDIFFLSDNSSASDALKDLLPISMSLPQYEGSIVTRYYLGTEKSFPSYRKYSGDTEMVFDIRCEKQDNSTVTKLANLLQTRNGYKHYEFDRTYDKVQIMLKDKTGNVTTTYTLYNVIINTMTLSEIGYENEDKVQCTLSMHYDFWEVV